jgi:hypothetical protein
MGDCPVGNDVTLSKRARRSIASTPRALSLCGHVQAFSFRDCEHAIELFDPKFTLGEFVHTHAFRDPAKRKLFGEHLVAAGAAVARSGPRSRLRMTLCLLALATPACSSPLSW